MEFDIHYYVFNGELAPGSDNHCVLVTLQSAFNIHRGIHFSHGVGGQVGSRQ